MWAAYPHFTLIETSSGWSFTLLPSVRKLCHKKAQKSFVLFVAKILTVSKLGVRVLI